MPYYIRTATLADAPAILAVYAPFVEHTDVSFEISVPSVEEYEARIRQKLEHSTFLVVADEASSRVVGFAYNGSFRERPAYDWASEISIYLAPEHQGCGLGSVLLDALEELMRAQGVIMSEACITSSNEGSVAFHAKHGYAVCGEHHACGYKLGRWLDVTWMEKQLAELPARPAPRRPASAAETERILAAASARLHKK